MKKIYECPTIEIVALNAQDIIVMSNPSSSVIVEEDGSESVLQGYGDMWK